jgi:hypothetical protein
VRVEPRVPRLGTISIILVRCPINHAWGPNAQQPRQEIALVQRMRTNLCVENGSRVQFVLAWSVITDYCLSSGGLTVFANPSSHP